MGILLAAALTVSVILFVYLIYSLDNANPLQKKTEIINRLIDLFKAQPVTKDVMKFKINTFDFYTEIKVDFKQAFQQTRPGFFHVAGDPVALHIDGNHLGWIPNTLAAESR